MQLRLPDLDRRSLEVALLAYQENQLPRDVLAAMVEKSSQIEQTFNTFRATLDLRAFMEKTLGVEARESLP